MRTATLEDPQVPDSAKHDMALGEELHAAVELGADRSDIVMLDEPLSNRGRPAAGPLRRLV